MRAPGIDDPQGPGKRTYEHRDRADENAGAGIQRATAHEEADSADSQKNSSKKRGVQAPLARGESSEQENPDRLAGNEQRGETGRHFLFGPVKRAVTD